MMKIKNRSGKQRALSTFDKALEIDNSLLEALFNKALCLQLMNKTEDAKAAWKKYLEKDPNSKWAKEARQNLRGSQ